MEIKDKDIGIYEIAPKAFEDIASLACEGVKNVYPVKKDKNYAEAKIGKNDELSILLTVKVKQGVDIVKLCNKLQDEVAENILLMTGVECKKINIDIQGFQK